MSNIENKDGQETPTRRRLDMYRKNPYNTYDIDDYNEETKYTIDELIKFLRPVSEAFEVEEPEHGDKETTITSKNIYKTIVIKKLSNKIINPSITSDIRTNFITIYMRIIDYLTQYYREEEFFKEFIYVKDILVDNINNAREVVLESAVMLYETLLSEYEISAVLQDGTTKYITLSMNSIMLLVSIYYYAIFISEGPDYIMNTGYIVNSYTLGKYITRDELKSLREVLTKLFVEIAKSDDIAFKIVRQNIVHMFRGDEEDVLKELETVRRELHATKIV